MGSMQPKPRNTADQFHFPRFNATAAAVNAAMAIGAFVKLDSACSNIEITQTIPTTRMGAPVSSTIAKVITATAAIVIRNQTRLAWRYGSADIGTIAASEYGGKGAGSIAPGTDVVRN
jgi:hypothetical protein